MLGNKEMKIIIKTVPSRESATKMHEWRDGTTGKLIHKTKAGRFTGDVYTPMYSRKLGAYNTGGLLDLIENPYYKTDAATLGKGWEYLTEKSHITRQEFLEKKHGKSPGFYTNRPQRKGDRPEDRTYMMNFKMRLNDGSTMLDTNIPEEELMYYILLDHPFVCASYDDYIKHLKPKATHYISYQGQDEDIKLKSRQIRNKAISKLENEDFIDEYKLQVIKALVWNKRAASLTSSQMYNIISEKIEGVRSEDLDKEGNDINKFEDVYSLLKDPKSREELAMRAYLQDLIDSGVVSNIRETYTWTSRGVVIGARRTGKGSALEYLMDESKQLEHDQMKAELKAKSL